MVFSQLFAIFESFLDLYALPECFHKSWGHRNVIKIILQLPKAINHPWFLRFFEKIYLKSLKNPKKTSPTETHNLPNFNTWVRYVWAFLRILSDSKLKRRTSYWQTQLVQGQFWVGDFESVTGFSKNRLKTDINRFFGFFRVFEVLKCYKLPF